MRALTVDDKFAMAACIDTIWLSYYLMSLIISSLASSYILLDSMLNPFEITRCGYFFCSNSCFFLVLNSFKSSFGSLFPYHSWICGNLQASPFLHTTPLCGQWKNLHGIKAFILRFLYFFSLPFVFRFGILDACKFPHMLIIFRILYLILFLDFYIPYVDSIMISLSQEISKDFLSCIWWYFFVTNTNIFHILMFTDLDAGTNICLVLLH